MKVLVYDPFLTVETSKDIGVEKVSFKELLKKSDIISIHTPLTNSTRNIINSKNIFSIKKGSSIINCARGGLIDENSLSAALKNNHLSGAAIDVFSEEPAKNNILFDAPNVILTPHLGASTKEAKEVCRGCVVREDCLEYALSHGEKFGIWGGMSERERRRLRRQRALARRAAAERAS